ncbi:tetraspanin 35 [Denticeps clupeoides]|uniref:Tetraspanin n=1 Tax=Denticeps clupeoides TaxID=299321 RepID=A0AAY4C8J1_9TELE|nr:tetraspanin-16 [Denticeps clupeoides]XP_028842877.1 tetraspanin-16 [Denticeps clupeoides]
MGCFGFLKVMMFIFNGIIFLAGAVILGVGIWVKVDSGSIIGFLNKIPNATSELSQVLHVGYLLIVVGAVLVLLGFLGCCGAVKESKCMLLLFFIIVLVVFIAEVAGAIVILVFKPLTESLINQLGIQAKESIQKGYGNNSDITGLWNATMETLKCCGFYNYTDFTGSPFVKTTGFYPQICCGAGSYCTLANCTSAVIPGCLPKLVTFIDSNAVVIIGVALGIALLELSAMIVSMVLYCKIGSK